MASDAGHLLCYPPCKCQGSHENCQGTGYDQPLPTFSATYYDGADGKRHFSMRSLEGGADVGAVAKQMAERFNYLADHYEAHRTRADYRVHKWTGGGHARASGFDAPLGWEGE